MRRQLARLRAQSLPPCAAVSSLGTVAPGPPLRPTSRLTVEADDPQTILGVRAWSEGDEEEVSSSWVYRSAERGAVGALEEG